MKRSHAVIAGLAVALSMGAAGVLAAPLSLPDGAVVHAVVDLSHNFNFYGDGRFARQYLEGQKAVTSWNALYKFDLSNANLLVLLHCAPEIEYVEQDVAAIRGFLEAGGGVVLFGSEEAVRQGELAQVFGAKFVKGASRPCKPTPVIGEVKIESYANAYLGFEKPEEWQVVVTDADNRAVAAIRRVGRGSLLVMARSLAGSRPDASDPHNAEWLSPLLQRVASGKQVLADKPFRGHGLKPGDTVEKYNDITLHYSDYLKPYAEKMLDIARRINPVLEKRMGVPLSKGMASEIGLLATGGGGFSAGHTIGLAVWWGGFPEREESMIEFISHETTHSWVLPFPEIWNEPIATYMGNLVMVDMGYGEEGMRRIEQTIAKARKHDPEMKLYDISGKCHSGEVADLEGGVQNDVHWGKSYWIFEEFRRERPDAMARYFRVKRRLALPEKIKSYGENETVHIWSLAMGRDLFPWFRAHGFDVARERSGIVE